MASVKFEKGSQEWTLFQDYWKLCQEFWETEGNDEYWQQAVKAADDFIKKYRGKNEFFARKLASALMDTISEKEKERKN